MAWLAVDCKRGASSADSEQTLRARQLQQRRWCLKVTVVLWDAVLPAQLRAPQRPAELPAGVSRAVVCQSLRLVHPGQLG